MQKLKHLAGVIYDKLGDPRSKNALLFVLALLTLFGMVAPETATSLRDTVLGMAL
jgi:hypothetical protein